MRQVYFRSSVLKIFEGLERKLQGKIIDALKKISKGKWEKLDAQKVKGVKNGWRLRVSRWRVLYLVVKRKQRIEVIDIFLKKADSDYTKRITLFYL